MKSHKYQLKTTNKRAFTLLELIVVIIITGVMLGLAMPKLMGSIEQTRNIESDTTDGMIANAILRCREMAGDPAFDCPTNQLDIDIANLTPIGHWTYTVNYVVAMPDPDCGAVDFAVIATRNLRASGDGTRQRVLVAGINGCRKIRDNLAGGCFVATAVYGDASLPQVATLRQFRDEVLLQSEFGRMFVRYYYQHGPDWAKEVNKSEKLKYVIRVVLDEVVKIIEQ